MAVRRDPKKFAIEGASIAEEQFMVTENSIQVVDIIVVKCMIIYCGRDLTTAWLRTTLMMVITHFIYMDSDHGCTPSSICLVHNPSNLSFVVSQQEQVDTSASHWTSPNHYEEIHFSYQHIPILLCDLWRIIVGLILLYHEFMVDLKLWI